MIGQMGMMYHREGKKVVPDMLKMFRLGWSISGMFYNPILADLGPEGCIALAWMMRQTQGRIRKVN